MKVRAITFLILCILVFSSACSAVPPTQGMPTEAAVTQAAASTSLPLTPTVNPYLLDEDLQPYNATIFGGGNIDRSFLSQDGSTILVQTALGIFIYDVESGEELGFAQPWLKVVAFDGRYGYFIKPTTISTNDAGELTYEYRNLVPFIWDGRRIVTRAGRSLYGEDGEELDIYEFVVDSTNGFIYGVTQYERSSGGTILLGSPRQKILWSQDGDVYLDRFSVSNVWDAVFAPNGSYLAVSNVQGGNASVRLVKFDSEEGVSSVQLIQTHVDTFIENMAFSTNSGKVLSADYVGEVFVYDINDGSKYQLALTAEDCFEDNNARPIGKAVFLDEERVAIGTNTGMFIIWEPATGSIEKLNPTQKPITDIHVLSGDEALIVTRDGVTRFTISTEEVAPVVTLEGSSWSKLYVRENRLLRVRSLNNDRLQFDLWNTETFSKISSEVLSTELGMDYSMNLWETNDGQPVVGFSRYSADVNPLLLLDQENFDVIDSNYENENLSAGFSPVYIDALDQYVGVGLSGYELVFTGGDDPLFREPVARKSTLREIRSFTVSPDGSMAYALTEGMIQAYGLLDPSRSFTITNSGLSSYYGIDAVNEENLLLTYNSSRDTRFALLNLASQEITPVALPTLSDARLESISRGKEYPEGIYVFCYENWGLIEYDILNERAVKQILMTNDPSGLYWQYDFFPEENLVIGMAGGYYKLQKVNISF